MKYTKKTLELFFLTGAFIIAFSDVAYAYFDHGTINYVLQLLVGLFIGSLYAGKVYWGKIRAFFSKSTEEEEGTNS